MMTSLMYVLLLLCLSRVLYACDYSECPRLPCGQPVRIPGKCCPICPCERNGVYYDVGDLVYTEDDCETCECSKTGIQCLKPPCRRPDCSNPVQGRDDCCPTCGCLFYGVVFEFGTEVYVPDPCKECRCFYDGRVMCRTEQCPAPQCSNPYNVKGECCNRCGCKDKTGKEYSFGLIQPVDKCRPCTCNKDGSITCVEPKCPEITCSKRDQYIPNGQCCPVCQCFYMDTVYDIGDKMPTNDPCETNCKCTENGERLCAMMDCPPANCSNPISKRGQCCSVCGCEDKRNDVIYDFGLIQPVDKCNPCTCDQSGNIVCTPPTCPEPPCGRWLQYIEPGQCCPKCSCTFKQEVFYPGDVMPIPGNDPCALSCKCGDEGEMVCESMKCPSVNCTNPVTLPGECCPKCGCLSKKEIVPFGPILDDPCIDCACSLDGTIQCGDRQICPNIKCVSGYYQPPEGAPKECCKQCKCKFGTDFYKPGDVFEGPKCQTCECQYSGRVSCMDYECPKVLQCGNPEVKKGDCCATCPDGPSCMYKKAAIPFGHYREFGKLVCTCLGGNSTENGEWFPIAFCAPRQIDKFLKPLEPIWNDYGYEADAVDKSKKKDKKQKKQSAGALD